MAEPAFAPFPQSLEVPQSIVDADLPQAASITAAGPISRWCLSPGKRTFDVACSALLLVLALPLMVAIIIAIKINSPGPAILRQKRVGQNGRHFKLLKFRSMLNNCHGPSLTCKGDHRVTRVGRLLRKFKLDELPQLFNVLRGDMSLIGPRPHLPELFVVRPEDEAVLELRPGITGLASLKFRNEEQVLQDLPWEELRRYYIINILPEKKRLELMYARDASWAFDLKLIAQTMVAVLCSSSNGKQLNSATLTESKRPHPA